MGTSIPRILTPGLADGKCIDGDDGQGAGADLSSRGW
jgi:hypothetical protein